MRFTASASRLIVFTIAFGSLATAQQITPGKPLPSRVRITVHAGHVVRSTIPATIFGTFLEPIGNSTYGGLWAELLRNPSFESGLWDSRHVADMVRTDPLLTRASELGLPIPWEPLDATQGNRYEPRRGDAANSFESLAVFAVDNAETGVKQEIFLPAYRELEYRGSIFAQHLSGPPDLDISIRPRNVPDKILANAHVTVSSSDWTKYEFTLKLPPDAIAPLEPADFVISVRKATRIVVDQASLMPADAVDGIDPDMVRLSKEMHTPLLRFGGNFTSGYHWRDGIGPPDKRVSMRNIAWGMPEYNQFGTDEYLKFCQLIGAQPQIALNLGSGTPEEAAEWVRYVDEHWTSHSGLLWELGNELWGNWNLGYPSLDELAERTLAFSKAIRAVDPSARLIATGQDPDHFEQWNAEELKDPANTFELLSTHFVVTTTEVVARHSVPDRVAEATFALPDELGRKLRSMQEQINGNPNFASKAHIAFTEWLYWCCDNFAATAPRYDNMGGAVGAASFLNMLIRNSDVVPVSDMTGLIEFAGIWKKRGRVFATPAYYAFRMYSTAGADSMLEVESDSGTYDVHDGVRRLPDITNVSYLDIVAVRKQQGKGVALLCVNRDLTREIPAEIALDGFTGRNSVRIQQLASSDIYQVNDEVYPEHVVPSHFDRKLESSHLQFTFPAASVTRIDFGPG